MTDTIQGVSMTRILKRLPTEDKFIINEELAGLVPMATPHEQAALTADIKNNTQREPIVLWHGKVIDGRCRLKALETLNWPVEYKELDKELTKEEAIVFVKSVNTRRNLTITQKAMSAAKSKEDKIDNRANALIAKSWAISKDLLQNALYITRTDTKLAQDLFDGKSVNIINKDGKEISSTKVTAVYAHLKRLEEATPEVPFEHGYNVNSMIDTQAGKDYYYEQLKIRKDINLKNDLNLCMLVGELANLKYPTKV